MENKDESIQEDFNELEEEETSKNDEELDDEPSYDELQERLKAAEEARRKAEQIAENQKIRAEKAEKASKAKKPEKQEETKTNENYSIKDIRALNDIADEDLDDFMDLTKKFGLSPYEAKQNKDVQAILRSRAEERKTAEATNIGTGRRGSSKISGEELLQKASQTGKMPESDKEIEAMARARYSPKS